MRLLLDARGADIITVGFWNEKSLPEFFEYQRGHVSILEFLEQHTDIRKVKGIVIIPGPGGFSTVRTAALFANLAGFVMRIPVLAIKPKSSENSKIIFARGVSFLKEKKQTKTVKPIYAGAPNITKPKIRVSCGCG